MDKVEVKAKRDKVPEWARDDAPDEAYSEPQLSPPQASFLSDLLIKKQLDVSPVGEEKIAKIKAALDDFNKGGYGMSKNKASELISWLLAKSDKPREEQKAPPLGPAMTALPPGRYALPKAGTKEADNEIRFYHCWQNRRDESDKRLYVLFGPWGNKLPANQAEAVANLIVNKHGIRDCAIRYGMEIRECSNCGRGLTNRISRELGIGPICGGRMFGESEFKAEVKAKRADLIAQGINPDEELDDE